MHVIIGLPPPPIKNLGYTNKHGRVQISLLVNFLVPIASGVKSTR